MEERMVAGLAQWNQILRSVEAMHRDLERRAPFREKRTRTMKYEAFVCIA